MPPENAPDKQSLIDYLQARLPELVPIHQLGANSQVFVRGDPGEVVVHIIDQSLIASVFAVVWETPYTSVMVPEEYAILNWHELSADRLQLRLDELIDSARRKRLSRYRTCERCGENKPPEHMHSDEVCQSCAEEHLGIVY